MDTVEKTVMLDQTEDLILRSQQADLGLDLHSQDKLELVLVMDRVEGMVSQCFPFDYFCICFFCIFQTLDNIQI